MPARYSALPTAQDAEHEMDAAFASDDEDAGDDEAGESTPLQARSSDPPTPLAPSDSSAQRVPGAYDFEASGFDYARPPPGSPPHPSTRAHPNSFGNSNGFLPEPSAGVSVARPTPRGFLRRITGALLPQHYQRVPGADAAQGGGVDNDGVFSNLMAKPQRGRVVQDGESIYVVPEEVQKETPPSYAAAQADAVPAYYETVVHAPSSGMDGEVLVDGLPVGSIFGFAWTMLISMSFQFVGFMLTYLLHTSHSSKLGSRAGLGVTIVQYAFYLRRDISEGAVQYSADGSVWWDSSSGGPMAGSATNATGTVTFPEESAPRDRFFAQTTNEWLSFALMSVGWFVLLTSLLGFWRVKRWESSVRAASEPSVVRAGDERARERVQLNMHHLFGLPLDDEDDAAARARESAELPPEEAQLRRDLRASGLL